MKNKNKKIIVTATALGLVALVSTGFASWVISGGDTKIIDGSISVETVNDNSRVLTVTPTDSDKTTLSFGATNTKYESPWLTTKNGTAECKSVTYTVTCTNYDANAIVKPVVKYVKDSTEYDKISALYTTDKNFSTYINDITAEYGDWSVNDSTKTGTTTLTVSYTWGSAFILKEADGSLNPYDYYNSQAYTADLGTEASTRLTNIYNALNGVSFKVTCAVNAPDNA
jgi:hypothetical protein